jgi:WD40 repeat protein
MRSLKFPPQLAVQRACGASCLVVVLIAALESSTLVILNPAFFFPPYGPSVVSCDLAGNGALLACVYSYPLSPDHEGRRYSLVAHNGARCTTEILRLPAGVRPKCVAGHPFRRQLYVGAWDGSLYEFDLSAGRASCKPWGRHAEGYVANLRCSPDGRVVVSRGVRDLVAWDAQSGERLWQRALATTALAFATQAPRLFCGLHEGELAELDLASGETLALMPSQNHGIGSLAASPGGDRVVSLTSVSPCIVFDVSSRQIDSKIKGSLADVAFSSDGQLLISAECDCSGCLLALRDARTGTKLASLRCSPGVSRIRYGPDGTLFAWGSNGPLRKWRIAPGAKGWEFFPAGIIQEPPRQ